VDLLKRGITTHIKENCTDFDKREAHPHLNSLQNIQLEFLPLNTTSLLQPMGMEVIKKYENLILHKIGKLHP
jgi:hypothetical protein